MQELRKLLKNRFLCFMYFIAPLLVGIFVCAILEKGVISELNVGVIDLDSSQMSRNIIFDIQSASMLNLKAHYANIFEAQDALESKEIYALIVLPQNLEAHAKRQIPSEIGIYYNAQFVSIAKNIQSALTQIFTSNRAKIHFAQNISSAQNADLALLQSIPFRPNIIALYNKNSDFGQFLLTIALPCLWQLFIVLCMIGIIASDDIKRATIIDLLARNLRILKTDSNNGARNAQDSRFIARNAQDSRFINSALKNLFAKFLINSAIFFAWWLAMSALFVNLGYQDASNFALSALNALVLILAYSAVGILIIAIVPSHTKAISVAAIYATPSLAFIGVTFPLSAMGVFATFWSSILPITRYIQAYFAQVYYQIEGIEILAIIAPNAIFLCAGILGAFIYAGTIHE